MQGYATANLLRAVNRNQPIPPGDLAPEVEAPPAQVLEHRDPEARLIFRGLLILVFFIGLFALSLRDREIRERRDRALIEAANRPVAEVCEYLELTHTPYTYAICTQKNAGGKVVYKREGM